MDKRKKILVIAGATTVLVLGGGSLAYASGAVGDSEQETTVTGADADRAGKVALDKLGGGQVVKVLKENEAAVAYEVEVKKADGSVAEVEVTKDFTVAPPEADDSGPESSEPAK